MPYSAFRRWLAALVLVAMLATFFASAIWFSSEVKDTNPKSHRQSASPPELSPLISDAGLTPEQKINAWIARFTAALVFSTAMLWWSTKKAADGAMKAASIAEKALLHIERPWMFVETFNVRRENKWGEPKWYISLKWKNVGRTPAIIKKCKIKFYPKNTMPDTPDYSGWGAIGF